MASVGSTGPILIVAVAGLLAGTLLWVLYRAYQSDEDPTYPSDRWYRETVDHCDEALNVLDAFESESGLTHDETRRAIGEMVTRLSTHAGNAVETEVDEEVLTELRTASLACRDLQEAHIEIGDASAWDDAFERARRSLQSTKDAAENHRDVLG